MQFQALLLPPIYSVKLNRGPQVTPQPSPPPPPPPLPSHVPSQAQSSVKVSREVQTSFTWLNDTPLWVPEMRVQKQDSETQTFCRLLGFHWVGENNGGTCDIKRDFLF